MNAAIATQQQHPFPTVRVGGLWFIAIGVTIVAATLLASNHVINVPLFVLGFIAGVAGILLNRRVRARLSYGVPSQRQRMGMWVGLGLNAVLFTLLGTLGQNLEVRTFWLIALIIVGLHFLPFSLLHGPKVAVLGVLCVASALAGLLWTGVPFLLFGLIDGLLKIGFGIALYRTGPVAAAAR